MQKHKVSQVRNNIQTPHGVAHQQTTTAEMYSGIIPSSDEMARYEESMPGAMDRIIKLAEEQQKHVIEMQQRQQIEYEKQSERIHQENCKTNNRVHLENLKYITNTRMKIVSSIVVCLIVVSAGIYAIYSGSPKSGASIITLTVIGVITSYISDRFIRKNTTPEKSKDDNKKAIITKDSQ